MKKNHIINISLILLSAFLVIIPLYYIRDSEFRGTDGQAETVISDNSPVYEPWLDNLWEPPGGEVETLLFSLQAAAGAAVLFFGLGYFLGKRDRTGVDHR